MIILHGIISDAKCQTRYSHSTPWGVDRDLSSIEKTGSGGIEKTDDDFTGFSLE